MDTRNRKTNKRKTEGAQKYLSNPTDESKEFYKQKRNRITELVRNAYRESWARDNARCS